jgi:hypothetical protein
MYEKCPGLNHGMCRNAYSRCQRTIPSSTQPSFGSDSTIPRIWSHLSADASLGDWFGFCIGRVPYSRETVYISLMEFYEHLLDQVRHLRQYPQPLFVSLISTQVMAGADSRLSVVGCGGSAHLAAVVGLGMLPIMDSIHRQHKAYTDMKVRGLGLCFLSATYSHRHAAAKYRFKCPGKALSYRRWAACKPSAYLVHAS